MIRNSVSMLLLLGVMASPLANGVARAQEPAKADPPKTETPKTQDPKVDPAVPPPAKEEVPRPVPVGPPPYLLAGDDVISITVGNFPHLSGQMIIPPDGKIAPLMLEPFSILGKTTTEVAATLTEKWKKYLVNPSVAVALIQKRKENVLVYGAVAKPGTTEYRNDKRLVEAIAEVGGTSPIADLRRVMVTRKSGQKLTLDLSKPEKGTVQDLPLETGDVIYVPERHSQFSVVGEVNKPGSYEFKDDMTVLDALTAVGGVKETADLGAATLIHDGKENKIDLDALLRRGDMSPNIKLTEGDRLLIPEANTRTYVFGAVGRPGYYMFKPNDRVLDALNGAGGPVNDADLGKVNLIHVNKNKTEAKMEVLDLTKFLKKGDIKYNAALTAGDVLYVPFRKKPFQWQDLLGILSGVNIVSAGARLLH